MQYEIIRRVNGDSFVSVLNAAVAEGKRAVSAGASYNHQARCLEWWAIMEKPDEVQAAPETPKDEHTKLLEALRGIRDECEGRANCYECKFRNGHLCALAGRPEEWDV